jgi:hypothetical protein
MTRRVATPVGNESVLVPGGKVREPVRPLETWVATTATLPAVWFTQRSARRRKGVASS